MGIRIITTHDGSHSLFHEELNETYHSVHGALQESVHVFIKSGLNYFCTHHLLSEGSVLEIGFGTGLNAWLTLREALQKEVSIHYTSVEAFPLEASVWKNLNYATVLEEQQWFEKIHEAAWNQKVEIYPRFHLHKIHNILQQIELHNHTFDIVYFDAFAPNKQPEMWAVPVLKKVFDAIKPGGIFVTYCAKGQLKRDLKSLGFIVEAIKGPPGKREMIRAVKRVD
jgi:tRNA U34 5-methylaminomethyl-2-thiouridine-forming methyltransferase MnmC